MVFTNKNGTVIGGLDQGVYRKKVTRSKHLMRIYNGYGIDKDIIDTLKKEGCNEVRILEDGKTVYSSRFQDWLDHGIQRNFDGEQVFLPITRMEISDNRQKRLL